MMLCQKGWIKSKTRYKLSKNLVSGSPGPRGVAKEFTGFFFSFFSRERERERESDVCYETSATKDELAPASLQHSAAAPVFTRRCCVFVVAVVAVVVGRRALSPSLAW